MSNNYFLKTGEADKERLTILSELYNPGALNFLIKNGLKPGMTVLEVGCGTGHMACDLAEYVGPEGTVIALDSSAEQIEVAKSVAAERGVSNIRFMVEDIMNLNELNLQYDATYGKWVLEFLPNPEGALKLMYQSLKPGGLLVYESTDIAQTRYFSLPYSAVVEEWHAYGPKMFEKHGAKTRFASSGEAYEVYLQLDLGDVHLAVNQAVLKTAREKSVYRLGLFSSTAALLKHNLMSQAEINALTDKLIQLEYSDTVAGFYHNLLISGRK